MTSIIANGIWEETTRDSYAITSNLMKQLSVIDSIFSYDSWFRNHVGWFYDCKHFPVVSYGLPYSQPTQSHGIGNIMRCHVVKTTMSMPSEEVKTWVFLPVFGKMKDKE